MSTDDPGGSAFPDTGVLSAPTAELDIVETGKSRKPGGLRRHVRPPHVRLGSRTDGGVAPALARALRAEVELHFEERYPPVRIVFGDRLVLVEDGPGVAPDLQVDGSLPDLISLMVAPLVRGVPSPIDARGRAALGMVALGRVRIEGRLGLMRKFLSLIRV